MADALANASGTSLTGPSGHTDRRYLGAVADDCETDHDADLVLEGILGRCRGRNQEERKEQRVEARHGASEARERRGWHGPRRLHRATTRDPVLEAVLRVS